MLIAKHLRIHNLTSFQRIIRGGKPTHFSRIGRETTIRLGEDGFTLIELLAALAIMALLAGLAVPSYQHLMAEIELDGACRSLVSCIRSAQQLALNDGIGWNLIFMTGDNPGFGLSTTELRIERQWTPLPKGVRYASGYVPYGTVMHFYPANGVGVSGNQLWTIGFTNRLGESRYVIISVATGRPRISSTPPPRS